MNPSISIGCVTMRPVISAEAMRCICKARKTAPSDRHGSKDKSPDDKKPNLEQEP